MKPGNPPRIGILQVIRLFAACMVILYHTGLTGARGFFGVPVFFIISGFLACYTTRAPVSAGRYLVRRCIRLLPLYWIFTVLTFIILTLRPGISNMSDEDPLHFLYSMLFIPYIGKTGTALPILAVGWTLYYEAAFMLLFALSLKISHPYRAPVCSALLLLLVAAGWLLKPEPLFISYYTSPWLFDFVLGLAAAMIYSRLRRSVPDDRPLLSRLSGPRRAVVSGLLSLLAAASLAFLLADPDVPFLADNAFRLGLPAFALILSLVLLLDRVRIPSKILALGNMTYSVFLVEYFTTSVYKRLVPAGSGPVLTAFALAVLFAATFALSAVSYQLIEVRLASRLRRMLLPS